MMEGLWYSDDFYGPHGREWVKVSATLVGISSALVAVKVIGDPNIPAGCITWKTKNWPTLNEEVPAEIQVRANPNDPNGYTWVQGSLFQISENSIALTAKFTPNLKATGTFYKES